jgi:hypothetical protein
MTKRDPCLDTLLHLDGQQFFADTGQTFTVKFEVKECDVTPERPHGIRYSLTLHDEDMTRVLGFDNAHRITEGYGPGARTRIEYDHKHKGKRIRFYDYRDAGTLLEDFWKEVDAILQERSN